MRRDNPIIKYYDQAIALGYAIEEISLNREWKRLKCIAPFRQPRYGHITQWEAGEYMELPLKTPHGIEMDEQRFRYRVSEMASDMFNRES